MNFDNEKVDVKENTIIRLDYNLLSILLYDHSTNKNIIFEGKSIWNKQN